MNKGDDEMVVNRHSERIDKLMECKSWISNEKNPENKKSIVYDFKYVETDKINNCILFGCESDELYENNKLFKLWSDKFLIQEIGMKKSKQQDGLL